MVKRKAISKKDRFEVFKRDSFTCQYCGQSAPDVVLHLDHIQPVSKGGDDDITNLITSCASCNLGKSNRELSDHATIQKKKAQLDELQERREQLEMLMKWNRELINLSEDTLKEVVEFWNDLITGYYLNDSGIDTVKGLLRKFEVGEILEAMRISADQYFKYDDDGKLIQESAGKALDYIGRICTVKRQEKDKPYLRDLYYVRGIVRKRMYCKDWYAIQLLEKAYMNGWEIDELKQLAIEAKNWTEWRDTMERWAGEHEQEKSA